MDLSPSDLEEAVRAASEAYIRDNLPLSRARERAPGVWGEMAAMGWFAMTLPEERGGTGMSLGAEALVFAELGRNLAPLGAIAAAVATRIADAAGEQALVDGIAGGELRVALGLRRADGTVRALDAHGADLVCLAELDGATIHRAPGLNAGMTLDISSTQAIGDLNGEPVASSAGRRAWLHQQIAAAAFALGCGETARDMAAQYAKVREQFGRPIGAFQGIKHPIADMAVRSSAARAQVLYAAMALDGEAGDAAFHVAAAKRLAVGSAIENARACIQVHGGIGMTDECDAGLLIKRAHTLSFVSPDSAAALLEHQV